MIARMLAIVFLIDASLAAQGQTSQPPAPSGREETQAVEGEAKPNETDTNRFNIDSQTITIGQENGPDPAGEGESENGNSPYQEKIITIATTSIALFTGILMCLTWRQWVSYWRVERAYVDMSHNPPGLTIDDYVSLSQSEMPGRDDRQPMDVNVQQAMISARIMNHGSTPARVTRVLIQPMWASGPCPSGPPYDESQATEIRAFLVRTKSFNERREWMFEAAKVQRLTSDPDASLYIIGYVDYIDVFHRRHRAGYGRVYDPHSSDPKNNLPYLTVTGYNYDRRRKKGQGNDWDDPPD